MSKYKRLLIKNCSILNPVNAEYFFGNISVEDGKILEISKSELAGYYDTVLDAGGKLTVPGLIDIHAHVFPRNGGIGVEPDEYCIKKGVTAVIDAGTTGAENFEDFKSNVIDKSSTLIKVFLNISKTGITKDSPELMDSGNIDYQRVIDTCRKFRNHIIGIKVRLSRDIAGENALKSLENAVRAAEETGMPLMVHPNNSMIPVEDILGMLRKGDIFTHCFHEGKTCILDQDMQIREFVLDAKKKGIFFDLGHGVGSFSFVIARAALEQGFRPHTISTDLHFKNVNGPVYGLLHTMSKFLSLGMSLEDVVASVTIHPQELVDIGRDNTALKEGTAADISILETEEGSFEFSDSYGNIHMGDKLLSPWATVYGNKIYEAR